MGVEEEEMGGTPKPPAEKCLCTLLCHSHEDGNPESGEVCRDISVLGTALVRLSWPRRFSSPREDSGGWAYGATPERRRDRMTVIRIPKPITS